MNNVRPCSLCIPGWIPQNEIRKRVWEIVFPPLNCPHSSTIKLQHNSSVLRLDAHQYVYLLKRLYVTSTTFIVIHQTIHGGWIQPTLWLNLTYFSILQLLIPHFFHPSRIHNLEHRGGGGGFKTSGKAVWIPYTLNYIKHNYLGHPGIRHNVVAFLITSLSCLIHFGIYFDI